MAFLPLITASLVALLGADEPLPRKLADDYPTAALMRNQSGAVHMRYWADREGKVFRCEVLQVFGGEVFRPAACKSMIGIRFKPARNADGSASYGMITAFRTFVISGGRGAGREFISMRRPADLTLRQAEAGSDSPDIMIAVQVQPDGSVGHCEGIDDAAETLVEGACAEAKRRGALKGTDAAGAPISYVTGLLVRYDASNGS